MKLTPIACACLLLSVAVSHTGALSVLTTKPSSPRSFKFDPTAYDLNRVMKLLGSSRDKIEPRGLTAFVTDPALLVTILHSLEIAYWTLPFGFILTPIINLFRMPNRRLGRDIANRQSIDVADVNHFHQTLLKAINKMQRLNRNVM